MESTCPHCGRPWFMIPPAEKPRPRRWPFWLIVGTAYAIGIAYGAQCVPQSAGWNFGLSLIMGLGAIGAILIIWGLLARRISG